MSTERRILLLFSVSLLPFLQDMGPHIFQSCPSANYFDCKAMSIGARSQSARTYLERHMDKFMDCKRGQRRLRVGVRGSEEVDESVWAITNKVLSTRWGPNVGVQSCWF